ncbi:MAG: CPCC family cysteine-rich protein [Clostridium sp.]
MTDKYIMKCPVCGEEVEFFDICDNCNWQNNGPKDTEDMKGGNRITLKEASGAYKKGEKIL